MSDDHQALVATAPVLRVQEADAELESLRWQVIDLQKIVARHERLFAAMFDSGMLPPDVDR